MPFMYVLMLSTLVSFLQMFATGMMGLLWAGLSVTVILYTLICVYSLYDKFKKEKIRKLSSGPVANARAYPANQMVPTESSVIHF